MDAQEIIDHLSHAQYAIIDQLEIDSYDKNYLKYAVQEVYKKNTELLKDLRLLSQIILTYQEIIKNYEPTDRTH